MDKPNGFVMLRPEDLPGPLFDLKLTDLPGISAGVEGRLLKAGVTNIEQLWHLQPKQARKSWGSVEGERFWAQLRGYVVSRPETERRMFGHGRVLSREWRQPANARDCLRLLTAKAARRLRREDYLSSVVSIGLTTADGRKWGLERHVPPARDDHTFLACACALFDAAIARVGVRPLKKVSVSLSGLSRAEDVTGDLFDTRDTQRDMARWQALTDTMDTLNARYETSVVSLGMHRQPRGGYAGAKIAFGRVPDMQDFAAPMKAENLDLKLG